MSDGKFNAYLLQQYVKNQISRRQFIGTLAAAGASATLINGLTAQKAHASTPKMGGKLTIGTE